uniref:receptor-like protein EIX2 n=1 Tax=Erigeron canadensis TaxID=72917 RepID=UPI001CB9C5F8|nr:receptor-like protein EIX2 [Erigeron canadensis]
MDLTSNSIIGDIPNSLGSLSKLELLHLHDNKFEGGLPVSLQKLKNLVTMDLGNNYLTGNIPFWIGKKLSKLKILNLQSNMFMGMFPPELCQIKTLQHLNLADNKITGNIPRCLCNLTGMIKRDAKLDYNSYGYIYTESIEACIKGIQQKYTSTLPYLISLDLSSNKIVGEIPDVLMNLEALTNLNLSRNELSGHIPTIIGNLKSMESLDLSMNNLSGRVPPSLASVNTLGYLNLSFNKLSGPLPIGNHFQTFDNPSIYEGNNRLCGFPLLSCKGNLPYTHVGDDKVVNSSQGFSWFYVGIVSGFVVGFMGLIVSLLYIKVWRETYFEMIENVCVFLIVSIVVTFARLRRRCFQ